MRSGVRQQCAREPVVWPGSDIGGAAVIAAVREKDMSRRRLQRRATWISVPDRVDDHESVHLKVVLRLVGLSDDVEQRIEARRYRLAVCDGLKRVQIPGIATAPHLNKDR